MNRQDNKWLPLKNIKDIGETINTIHCDTRDFHVLLSQDKPEIYKKAECGYEQAHNEGLQRLYRLFKKTNRADYVISSSEIKQWLTELCEKTGGQDKDWRSIFADVDFCRNWEIKYIRFVRNLKCLDEFIVCNAYLMPVKWKEIIPNLQQD